MEVTDEPNRCGEVAWGGCLFTCNVSVTRPTVFMGAEKRHQTKHDASLVTRS